MLTLTPNATMGTPEACHRIAIVVNLWSDALDQKQDQQDDQDGSENSSTYDHGVSLRVWPRLSDRCRAIAQAGSVPAAVVASLFSYPILWASNQKPSANLAFDDDDDVAAARLGAGGRQADQRDDRPDGKPR